MNIKIYRYDPQKDEQGYYQEYDLPVHKEDLWTVMDLLRYIAANIDPTLAFYCHSACNHGICGRCALKVNGKVRLACTCLVPDAPVVLEPKNKKVVKDLVTEP